MTVSEPTRQEKEAARRFASLRATAWIRHLAAAYPEGDPRRNWIEARVREWEERKER